MKLSQTILALAIASAANAQLSSLPTCAQACAANAIPSSCGVDVACICGNKSFLSDIACCIAGKCTTAEQEQTLQAAMGICAAGGVTNLPSMVACTTGASSTTASGASTTSSDSVSTSTATGMTTATVASTTVSGTAAAASTMGSLTTTKSGTVNTSTSGSATASSTAAAAKTGGAALGQNKDASLLAAAGAAAAFAILI